MGHNVGEKLRQRKLWVSFLTLARLRGFTTPVRGKLQVLKVGITPNRIAPCSKYYFRSYTPWRRENILNFKFYLWHTVRTVPDEMMNFIGSGIRCMYIQPGYRNWWKRIQPGCTRRCRTSPNYGNRSILWKPTTEVFLHIRNVTDASATRNIIIRDLTHTVYIIGCIGDRQN